MNINTSEITDLVKKDFELSQSETPMSEEELLDMLTEEVGLMIETRLDFLLGLMYRLDIDEMKIRKALAFGNEDPPNLSLAKLILQRQKQRVLSKKMYKTAPIEGWDEF